MRSPIVTLLTDFGSKDHFAGILKGVILNINPSVEIVDISHNITPYNITEGAIILNQAFSYFPKGTIHIAVIDPGVGTDRKPILVVDKNYFFIGPDNGIFGLVYNRLKEFNVFKITNHLFFLKSISATFHGRDIFAPVAAHLSTGVPPSEMGPEITNYKSLSIPLPSIKSKNINGNIIYIDGFGNLVTNIHRRCIQKIKKESSLKIKIGGKIITKVSPNYQSVSRGNLLALIGSSEMVEIAVREGNACKMLGAKEGDDVLICK